MELSVEPMYDDRRERMYNSRTDTTETLMSLIVK